MSVQTLNPALQNVDKPRSSLRHALVVTRREMRDTLRDWRIVSPIVILVVVLPFILASVLHSYSEFLIKQLTADTFFNKLLPFTMLAIGFLPMSFCLVIALETFVGEKERNSLEALLTAPLTDQELFMGKYIAASIPTVAASVIGSVVFASLMAINNLPIPISFGMTVMFTALNAIQALVMVAGSVVVSSHTTSVRAANILASFIIMPMSLAVQLEAVLLLNNLANGLIFLFLGMFIILLLLLNAGIKIFNREDIVAREGDNISLKGIFRGFVYFFKRTPEEALAGKKSGERWTILRFYTKDIPQIVKLNRGALLALTVAIVGATLLSVWISYWPQAIEAREKLQFGNLTSNNENPLCKIGDLSANNATALGSITWQRLFIQNSTSVILASGLSLFSLGLTGIAMLMVSIGPVAGVVTGFALQLGYNPLPLFVGFILPHGIFEVPAIMIGVAAGLRLGNCVIAPPPGMSIGQSFQFAVVNFIKIMALVLPLLLIAALIEANLTRPIGCALTGGHL